MASAATVLQALAPTAEPAAAKSAPAPAVAPQHDPAEPARLTARLQGGAPLPPDTRTRMEAGFGQSFADVRVHTGGAAAEATARHQAEALTVGPNVAFAPGRFAPDNSAGTNLIAHELAHVAQQRAGGGTVAQAKSLVSSPSDSAEIAADAAAARVADGGAADLSTTGLNTRGRIMRRARAGAAMPAMSIATPAPVAASGPGAARPSATMTGLVSPAGERATAAVGARIAPRPHGATMPGMKAPGPTMPGELKGPDEAQTALPSPEAPPPSVAVAGASAGATAEGGMPGEPGAAKAGDEAMAKKAAEEKGAGKEKEEKIDKEEKDKKKDAEAAQKDIAAVKQKKKRKFGQIPGDRGAKAAKAAAKRVGGRGGAMSKHEPAGQRVEQAQSAAAPPANEGAAHADNTKINEFSAAEPPPPDPEAARAALLAAVEESAPATMEDMDDMEGRSAGIAEKLGGTVKGQAGGVDQSLAGVKETPAPEEVPPAGEQPPGAEAAPTADPELAAATPPAVPDSTVDASEFKEEADGALSEQDIDDETLNKSSEPPLAALAKDKKELDQKVDGAGEQARGTESTALAEASEGLAADEAASTTFMESSREAREADVVGDQDAARTAQETGRQSAADQIQQISKDAATAVGDKLDALTENATKAFDEKQQALLNSFTSNVRSELEAFKDDRYSGVFGWARWLKDKVVSINELDEVKELYERNRNIYVEAVKNLILEIVGQIDTTIAECKETLATARTTIQGIIDDLPEAKKAEALKAHADVEKRFGALERQVAQAATQSFNALAERRNKAMADVDRALNEIKAENEALLDKIVNFVKRLIDLLGKFLKLLTRITRMGLGTFISAALSQAKDGVQNHLWGAIQEAFKQWVFSKIPFLEPLLNLPPNWVEILTAMAVNLPSLFMEHLPAMLPAIGVAAMVWLATNLAAKLIPGAGAIMAIIDGIKAAIGLIQSLLSAAEAFFAFIMKVADRANAAADFAMALARGIIAALGALLTFLGVDSLIRRVGGAIAKPFGRIFGKLKDAFKSRKNRRREAKTHERSKEKHQREKDRDGDDPKSRNSRRKAEEHADREQRTRNRKRADDHRQRAHDERRRTNKDRKPDDDKSAKSKRDERKKNDERDKEREDRERLDKAVTAVRPKIDALLGKGVSKLRLRAQLAMWRLRYRIKKLALSERGVVAANSPEVLTNPVINENVEGVFRMVLDIARARLAPSLAANTPVQGTPGVEPKPIIIQPGRELTQTAGELRAQSPDLPRTDEGRPGVPFRSEVPIQHANAPEGTPPVTAQRSFGTGNFIITQLGRYPAVTALLRAQGLSDRDIVEQVTSFHRTGQGSVEIRALHSLLFGAEPARGDLAAALSPMQLAAMRKGTSTAESAFGAPGAEEPKSVGGGGRDFPPSQVGARTSERRGTATVEDDKAFRSGTAVQTKTEDYILRVARLVTKVVSQMEFRDTTGLRAAILKQIEIIDKMSGVALNIPEIGGRSASEE